MRCLLILFLLFQPVAWAIPDDLAVKCLIGEAGNQGYLGLQAVGEVLRKRSPDALCGCRNPVSSHASPKLRSLALKAWKASRKSNLTRGATHFENVKAFGRPAWSRGMKITARIKDHTFFK